jgi:hypothetical protein
MDAVDVVKTLGKKIADVQIALIDKMAPAFQEVFEQSPDFAKCPPEERRSSAEQQVAIMILASTLAIMRGHGYTDAMLQKAVEEARALEQKNFKESSS